MEGCRLGQEIVTADLEGYAPTAGLAVIGSNSAPMNLILGTGKTLRVRVVDPSGQPLAGATAFFNPFSGRRNDVLPQVTFQERSDAEGRIVWEHAPDQDLEFSFHATGFFERRGVELRTRDQEYVVTLSPVLTITGTVRDADTGRALPRFRMGIGWPEAALDGSIQPWWNNIGRFWPYFRGGGFRHVLTEAVIGGTSNRGYIFRFDAEGYSPQVTRVYRPDEGEVTMDIRLHRAEGTWITIYDHAGLPAAASEIGLLAPGSGLRIGLRGLTCRGDAGSIWILRADERGRVLLPADDSVRRVAVVHAEGYAESDAEELRRGRAIRLQPWGRMEGVWLEKGAPKSNGQVSLEPSSKAPDALPLDFGDYRAQSDSVGRFVFPRVPPGSLQLVEWRAEPPPNTARTAYPAATIQVRPGRTNHVQMGDGAATTGR